MMVRSAISNIAQGEYTRISVRAPSRIHISLIDMHGSFSGRVDGGVGIALDNPAILVDVQPREFDFLVTTRAEGVDDIDETKREVLSVLSRVQQQLPLPYVHVNIVSPLSSHAGLGSKTALLLSVARAYTSLGGYAFSSRELAKVVGRGGTSGIGVEAFDHGGLIVDCGHSFSLKGSTRAEDRAFAAYATTSGR